MKDVSEVMDRAARAREWERDREAWNLPRAPRAVGAASTNLHTDEVASAADVHPAAAHRTVERLPQDISELDRDGLRKASDTRDERISILFRRWPSLDRIELKEIRQLHDERQRLARYLGLLRNNGLASREHLNGPGLPGDRDDTG